MALFSYSALDQQGAERKGTIEATGLDVAIGALQRRGLIVSNIQPVEDKKTGGGFNLFQRVTNGDIVMLSRQMTTLFEAQVSALRAFRLLASEARTPLLGEKLSAVANDIQNGSSISSALGKHPDVFSAFYVNMVRSGEEAGKLDETFSFLADYLDRNYEITQKAKNALIYPAFIMVTFVVVMTLVMTLVIPQLASMLTEVGQSVPLYTRVVIGMSVFLRAYIIPITFLVLCGVALLVRYAQTRPGQILVSRARLQIPHIGTLFQKLFLSRIADNLSTMLKSGVQMLRGLEITALVVDDPTYEEVLSSVTVDVKNGLPVSEAFRKHPEIPGIVVAMIKIGEETGNMGHILEVMAKFYRREVNNSIDTLVSLIEPVMIVSLAVGVAFLLAAVLVPIYNIASGF